MNKWGARAWFFSAAGWAFLAITTTGQTSDLCLLVMGGCLICWRVWSKWKW